MKILLFTSLVVLSLNLHAFERMTVKSAQSCHTTELNGKELCSDISVKSLTIDYINIPSSSHKGSLLWRASFEIQPSFDLVKFPVNLPLAKGDGKFAGCFNHLGGSGSIDKNDYEWTWKNLISLDYSASVSWHGNWGYEVVSMQIARSADLKMATISYSHSCNASNSRYTKLRYLIDATIGQ